MARLALFSMPPPTQRLTLLLTCGLSDHNGNGMLLGRLLPALSPELRGLTSWPAFVNDLTRVARVAFFLNRGEPRNKAATIHLSKAKFVNQTLVRLLNADFDVRRHATNNRLSARILARAGAAA